MAETYQTTYGSPMIEYYELPIIGSGNVGAALARLFVRKKIMAKIHLDRPGYFKTRKL
jgi:hypothetical protein